MSSNLADRFRLGINYWPARTAMGWWSAYDKMEVRRDFTLIREAGFDSVRIFLTWEDFQPDPTWFDPSCLANLLLTLDLADELGLLVMPTLFTGHMSGVNWVPGWALGGNSGDERFRVSSGGKVVKSRLASWYTDEAIVRGQSALAAALARAASGHPALWAWDLGNENSNLGAAPDKDSARNWLSCITEAIRSADPSAKITIGLHMEDLEHDRNLGPHEAAEVCDFLTMHGYPGYAPWTDGPTDERLLPFLTRLTSILGGGKEVLFSEFGVPTRGCSSELGEPQSGPALVSEDDAAGYVARALLALQKCGSTGAMLWCFADYASELHHLPPLDLAIHERTFGLWRADGSPKPSVAAVKHFSGWKVGCPPVTPLPDSSWFDLDLKQFYAAPERALPHLYRRYCKAALESKNAIKSDL